LWLAGYLLIYGWSKVFLMQMGRTDYSDALIQFGEMSPMGLLWRFMSFSPEVQFLAGLAEVAAAALLLFRRTVWLGATLAAVDMAVVFVLNLTFDVPVKQLSGIMVVVAVVLLAPNIPRLISFIRGEAAAPAVHGDLSSNRLFVRVTRVASPGLAIVIIIGSGAAFGNRAMWGQVNETDEISGVYRVNDTGERSIQSSEITQLAFGRYLKGNEARVGIRYADGSYQDGTYSIDDQGSLDLELYPKLKGDQSLQRTSISAVPLTVKKSESGELIVKGEGLNFIAEPDSERRYLFDRDFSWEPRLPVNR
jgi:uncharacterized membrane protein YphA (DoxX/SURF4 family)